MYGKYVELRLISFFITSRLAIQGVESCHWIGREYACLTEKSHRCFLIWSNRKVLPGMKYLICFIAILLTCHFSQCTILKLVLFNAENECFYNRVVDVVQKEKSKGRPTALNTVELLRSASSGLGKLIA